jgi:hypothetical protein
MGAPILTFLSFTWQWRWHVGVVKNVSYKLHPPTKLTVVNFSILGIDHLLENELYDDLFASYLTLASGLLSG